MRPENVTARDWLAYNALFFAEHFLGHGNYRRLFASRERKLWDQVDRYATDNPPREPFRVIEHADPDAQPLFHPYVPEVFRGIARDWPCVKKWTFDFFAERYGDKKVYLTSNRGLVGKGAAPRVENGEAMGEELTLREYIAQLKNGTPKYLKFSQMIHESSELQEDFNADWLTQFHKSHEFKKLFFLFIGGKGTATPIHTALPPTVFVQIQGTKKWTFYPCNDRLFLGVRPDRRSYFFTDANPAEPDERQFPLLKHAQGREVLLHPGDVVWFPPCCWHQVENTTDSIGVAYKFFDVPAALRASKMLTLSFFCATKPSLLKSSIMARLTKREYIFNNPQRYD